MQREIKIQKKFEIQGQQIVDYIRNNSPQNAEKFKTEVERIVNDIMQFPETYPPEPFLYTKNNLYRFAKVMKSWKIIFKVSNEFIVFLGIVHTARNPEEIQKLGN